MWLKILGLSVISAMLYNLGGQGKKGNFLDCLRYKLTRRLGCALVQFIAIFFVLKISAPWWVHLASIGITYGFLTTYWDGLTPDGSDSHGLHGAGIAFGMILYAITSSIPVMNFIVRIFVLGFLMEYWSRGWDQDWIEELGRGAFIILALPIICL